MVNFTDKKNHYHAYGRNFTKKGDYIMEYLRSAGKTAKINGLTLKINGKHKILFDFSAVDALDISDDAKTAIKESVVKNIGCIGGIDVLLYKIDNFTNLIAVLDYMYNPVYSDGKKIYTVVFIDGLRVLEGTNNTNKPLVVIDTLPKTPPLYRNSGDINIT